MALRNNRGFSMVELLIVISVMLILLSAAVLLYGPVVNQQHVTDAYNWTMMSLRQAREQAAGDMRTYVVAFTAPGTITVTQNTTSGPVLLTVTLPADVTFHVEPGVPTSPTVIPTTPDGFGTAAFAIDFDQGVSSGGYTLVQFNPDGTATDPQGNLNNGVVYLGRPGDLYSSRAITLWGATGRLRGWRLYNVSGTKTWSQQ